MMKYWFLLGLMAVSGSVFAQEVATEDTDIEVRVYNGISFDNTSFSVVHDTVRKVTCYITESGSSGSSPVQTCFPDDEIR